DYRVKINDDLRMLHETTLKVVDTAVDLLSHMNYNNIQLWSKSEREAIRYVKKHDWFRQMRAGYR
ncbi:MAG: hypothetical protein ACI4F3_05435, partial [Enterocloster sp.]